MLIISAQVRIVQFIKCDYVAVGSVFFYGNVIPKVLFQQKWKRCQGNELMLLLSSK